MASPTLSYPGPMKPPPGARRMGDEFGRRLRSFLTGGAWWEIAQLARSELGEENVWLVMFAGIDPSDNMEDFEFAQAINWAVNRRDIDLTNVETYSYPDSNWWYVDLPPGYPEARVAIWGAVFITLREDHGEAVVERKARDFAEATIVVDLLRHTYVDADDVGDRRYLVNGTVVVGPDD